MKKAFKYLREILFILGKDRTKVPWMLLLFWGSSLLDLAGLGLVTPYIGLIISPASVQGGKIGDLINLFNLPNNQEKLLVVLGIALVGIFLLKAMTAIGINYIIIRFSQNQQIRLSSLLLRSYQALPYTEFLHRNSSEYIYNIHVLVKNFTGVVVLNGLRTLSELIVAVMILGLLAWNNVVALGLFTGLLCTIVFGYDYFFRHRLRHYGQRINQLSTKMVQGIHEAVEGLKEIRILGKESHFHNKVHANVSDLAIVNRHSSLITLAPRYIMELLIVSFVVMLVTGTMFFSHTDMQSLVGTLGMFGVAALRMLPTGNALISSLMQLRFQRNTVSRLYNDLVWINQLNFESPRRVFNPKCEEFRHLILEKVRFSYPKTFDDALSEISLKIQAGESIGLVGTSGSGKTTLVDVLLGVLEPQKGKITFNGKLLGPVLSDWRAKVAYLPQQAYLIDNSVRCNVALGLSEEEIDDSRIKESLQKARLLETVEKLPQGLNTMLGERGIRLSGGQRQRVALARAFYHEREVLVMDEATSALDNETELEIIEEVKLLKGQKTLIVIAHRLSTVQHCDMIYRLEHGKIIESGAPDKVLN